MIVALALLAACDRAPDARSAFERDVLPVLEARCLSSGCHGVAEGAEEAGETVDWSLFYVRVDAAGRAVSVDAARAAAVRAIDTVEDPAFSTLLRKPLPEDLGGLPHYGGVQFAGRDDPAWRSLYDWVLLEESGGEDPEPLDALETQFAETVQPALVEGSCLSSGCHGRDAGAIPFALDVGVLGTFPIASTRANYALSRAQLALDGHAEQSRLLRKAQPLPKGIAHRGLNFDFFAGDPGDGPQAIRAWACAERLAATGVGCTEAGEPPARAFVFVAGPVEAAHPFELDAWSPGRSLRLAEVEGDGLAVASVEDLTAGLADGPVDVRDPAISPDGTQVAFAMRRSEDEGHALWLLDLETRASEQLTDPGTLDGRVLSDRDPAWGADGLLWFVSNRSGELDDAGQLLQGDLYSLDLDTREVRRWTSTPHAEVDASVYRVGPHAGEVAVTALRGVFPSRARAHALRFPPDLSKEYHQHFGISPPEDLFLDTRELPDGRYVATVGDLSGVWSAGNLGIVDRNLGPELLEGDPALDPYLPPLALLDDVAASAGATVGAWRDPAPLPDGRILAARTDEAFDLSDPGAAPRFHLELLSLVEAVDGSGPAIDTRVVLLEDPDLSLSDPEPVAVLAPPSSEAPHDPGSARTGLFLHNGLPMADALLERLPPTGARVPRTDMVAVRLVEAVPTGPSERQPVPPEETVNAVAGATTTGLTAHPPARILAELPLAEDGTFSAEIPAGVAFRIEPLDARGMTLGTAHNRWYDLQPGQTIRQGVSADPAVYGSSCAACHGHPEGDAAPPPLAEPDLMTTASLTLSRFEGRDPRRPIAAPALGDDTRIAVDFVRDVRPVLQARCVGCHARASASGGLDLGDAATTRFGADYEALLAPGSRSSGGFDLVDGDTCLARASWLVEVVTGEELDAPGPAPATPHPTELGAEAPTDGELATLVRWIELCATWRSE